MKFLLMIKGPTAVGKTEFAIKVAKYFGTSIISADSRQVYREMSIGTAMPTPEQLAGVEHYLVGHRSVEKHYNVSMFEHEALEAIRKIHESNNIALLTGGSGMYCDVIEYGIDELPDIDEKTRHDLRIRYKNKGLFWLQEEVRTMDPEYFDSVDRKNPARLLRALEVMTVSGKKLSSLHLSKKKERPFIVLNTGLMRPREELNRRIELRTERMISEGLVDECRKLYHLKNKSALKTVGYTEIFKWMDGLMSYDAAVEKIKTNTRRYAKRQMTWFRRDKKIHWFHPDDYNGYISQVTQMISDFEELKTLSE